MEKKVALITGATSGIGKATAHLLAQNNFDLILTGRRKERLEVLKEQLEHLNASVIVLPFDIRNNDETVSAISSIPGHFKKRISVLINNAGLAAGRDSFQNGLLSDWEQMIDTNIKGLLYISRLIVPLFIENKNGHIINIASIAGKEVYENGNVYCATKHAVDALSRSMRIDLFRHDIQVTNVAPGAVETEFSLVRFKGDKETADKTYEGFQPLTGEDIAEVILFAVTRPPHVSINDILITPKAQGNATSFNRK